jgi:hypothetical protein
MNFAGCQREMHRKPVSINDRVKLAGQTTSGTPHRLSSVPSDAGTMLMHTDDRRVDHLHGSVMGGS